MADCDRDLFTVRRDASSYEPCRSLLVNHHGSLFRALLGGRKFLKIALHARELFENRMLFGIYAVELEIACSRKIVRLRTREDSKGFRLLLLLLLGVVHVQNSNDSIA